MLKDEIKQRVRAHSEMIAMLAHIGKERGYDIWIGKPEQSAIAEAENVRLGTLVTCAPKTLNGVTN